MKNAIVIKRVDNSGEKNPYNLRRSNAVEIAWYDENGDKLGSHLFNARSFLQKISNNGSISIIVDGGFDPEEFESYHDVPNLKTTELLKRDPELVDHFIHVLNRTGEIIVTKKIKGPGYPISDVCISPSAKWFAYKAGNNCYVNNIEAKTEESFVGSNIHGIDDNGEVFFWKMEKDDARREKINGRLVWKSGKRIYRKYKRNLGEERLQPTNTIKEE